jgi:amidase
VRDAALVLGADGVAAIPPTRRRARPTPAASTMPRQLSAESLRGKRIGVMRFATGFGTDAAFDEALRTLEAQGATLVDIKEFSGRGEIGANEFKVLLTELKADLNAYLATTPPQVKHAHAGAGDRVQQRNAPRELGLFGQETFVEAEMTKGLSDPDYVKARATSLARRGRGHRPALARARCRGVGRPDDVARLADRFGQRRQYAGGGAGGLAAVAGYPHLTVPMGLAKGMPVGLSFMGPKWADAQTCRWYAYELASPKSSRRVSCPRSRSRSR